MDLRVLAVNFLFFGAVLVWLVYTYETDRANTEADGRVVGEMHWYVLDVLRMRRRMRRLEMVDVINKRWPENYYSDATTPFMRQLARAVPWLAPAVAQNEKIKFYSRRHMHSIKRISSWVLAYDEVSFEDGCFVWLGSERMPRSRIAEDKASVLLQDKTARVLQDDVYSS
jgi:hypothetical protein